MASPVIEGPAAVVGPRVAHLLMKRAGLERFRIDNRGQDQELDAALYALHAVALRWDPALVSDAGSWPGNEVVTGARSAPMTTAEVARHAGCTTRAVRYAASAGQLVGEQTSAGWLFDPGAVRTWTASRRGAA